MIRAENRSLRSLANGRSSSVMRRVLDEVRCMGTWVRSFVNIGVVPLSEAAIATWLRLCARFIEGRSDGEDGKQEKLGLEAVAELAWFERLMVEVAVRREGVDNTPKLGTLANADEVRTLAGGPKIVDFCSWRCCRSDYAGD